MGTLFWQRDIIERERSYGIDVRHYGSEEWMLFDTVNNIGLEVYTN